MFTLNNDMIDAINAEPDFLRVTPDGFDDGITVQEVLMAKPIDAEIVVKLFVDNQLVHTSEDCRSDPKCPKCNSPRARRYIRLRVEVEGRPYLIDLPPTAAPRFTEVARNGIDGMLRMTCKRAERRGRTWGEVGFEIVKEAA